MDDVNRALAAAVGAVFAAGRKAHAATHWGTHVLIGSTSRNVPTIASCIGPGSDA